MKIDVLAGRVDSIERTPSEPPAILKEVRDRLIAIENRPPVDLSGIEARLDALEKPPEPPEPEKPPANPRAAEVIYITASDCSACKPLDSMVDRLKADGASIVVFRFATALDKFEAVPTDLRGRHQDGSDGH